MAKVTHKTAADIELEIAELNRQRLDLLRKERKAKRDHEEKLISLIGEAIMQRVKTDANLARIIRNAVMISTLDDDTRKEISVLIEKANSDIDKPVIASEKKLDLEIEMIHKADEIKPAPEGKSVKNLVSATSA